MELDWWEENCVPGHPDIAFVCTPAQHWSKRTALDQNKVGGGEAWTTTRWVVVKAGLLIYLSQTACSGGFRREGLSYHPTTGGVTEVWETIVWSRLFPFRPPA